MVGAVRHPAYAAERAILEHGGVLLSVASLRAEDRARLKSEASGARGVVVLHAGLAPGVYSLVLKGMLTTHPEADRLEIAGAYSAFQSSGPGGATDFSTLLSRAAVVERRACRVPGADRPRPLSPRGRSGDRFLRRGRWGLDARVYLSFIERPVQAQLLALNAFGLLSRLPRRFFTLGCRWHQRSRRIGLTRAELQCDLTPIAVAADRRTDQSQLGDKRRDVVGNLGV